jgi:hypothetical protein
VRGGRARPHVRSSARTLVRAGAKTRAKKEPFLGVHRALFERAFHLDFPPGRSPAAARGAPRAARSPPATDDARRSPRDPGSARVAPPRPPGRPRRTIVARRPGRCAARRNLARTTRPPRPVAAATSRPARRTERPYSQKADLNQTRDRTRRPNAGRTWPSSPRPDMDKPLDPSSEEAAHERACNIAASSVLRPRVSFGAFAPQPLERPLVSRREHARAVARRAAVSVGKDAGSPPNLQTFSFRREVPF